MKGDTLIVFARAPRLGTVKRRLAAGIGAMAALRFYRGQLRRLLRQVGQDRRWRTELAVTPDRVRWPSGLPMHPQGRGDLGQRMHRAPKQPRRQHRQWNGDCEKRVAWKAPVEDARDDSHHVR